MKIIMLVFPDVQLLDVAGPLDVFAEAGHQIGNRAAYSFELVALEMGPLRASNGVRLLPDATLDNASANVDTLLVAGNPFMVDYERNPVVLEFRRTPRGSVSGYHRGAGLYLCEGRVDLYLGRRDRRNGSGLGDG